MAKAKAVFGDNGPKITTNQRLLGGHIGSSHGRQEYVRSKEEVWVHAVRKLAEVADKLPQAAYLALTKSLHCEWQYLQRVTKECGEEF